MSQTEQSFNQLQKLAIFSLAFLWIFTGITSIFLSPEIGYQILKSANINGLVADICVIGGGMLDITLGLWILSKKYLKLCCQIQVATIVIYTVLLSVIDWQFWLHPFGPVTKNIPICILILIIKSEWVKAR